MGPADEAIVARVDDNRVVGDAVCFELIPDHPQGHVDPVDLLIIRRHDAVIVLVVVPLPETHILPSLLALLRQVRSRFAPVVLRLRERLSRIDVIETGIRCCGSVRRLEADR